MKIEMSNHTERKIGFARPGEVWTIRDGALSSAYLVLEPTRPVHLDKDQHFDGNGWRASVPLVCLETGNLVTCNGSQVGLQFKRAKVIMGEPNV